MLIFAPMRSLRVFTMPETDYATAWRWQLDTVRSVQGGAPEAIGLLQHTPVYTLGRQVRPQHLLVAPEALRERGAAVVETNRGGDVTFHGPGQLVGYAILDLRRRGLGPAAYVRLLEETLIRALDGFGVSAFRSPGLPGVWTLEGKIGAIGVRIEGGVSLHGFALNVDPDLTWFDAIVPCGIEGATVTSMAQLLDPPPAFEAVRDRVLAEFATVFQVSVQDALLATQS